MSHKYYDEKWHNTQQSLSAILQSEPTQADRREDRQLLATLYVRYIVLANRLIELQDQMVQIQKRVLIKKLLEATLGRILELKYDLVEADLNDWTHCGDVMENLGISPLDCELEIPVCLKESRKEELIYRKNVIDNVLGKLGFLEKAPDRVPMSEQQAILIIQIHERARQGRLRAQFMKEIKSMKGKSKPLAGNGAEESQQASIGLAAALRIQKIWRGYVTRRATRRRKLQEMLLIGMIPAPRIQNEEIDEDKANKQRRKQMQKDRRVEYEHTVTSCREKLEREQRGTVLEQLSDQVRGWLHEYKEQTGKIPEFAGSERTSSRMMLSRQGTDSELSKSTQISSKDSKAKKEKSTKSKDSKSNEEEDDQLNTKAIMSTFLPELNVRKDEYEEMWKNKDETDNFQQFSYKSIIEHEQMTEMENSLRKVVDEMMRAELQLLQDALEKDRGHKGKKKSSKKIKKGGKKGKKRKEKDLTPDRTTESLFEELIANGIIKKCSDIRLKEFTGEKSYNHPAIFNVGEDPSIALGDVRQLLIEYCVVPLLSSNLHQTTQHIKSVLVAGPKGSGKDMLVHAVCNEIGATVFDLTPANIVGKYPGKSGLIMLIHLVIKVARLFQPSVIYMNDAERPFVKKIPKSDKTDPKRLKKDLPKIIKNMCQEDAIMLIGLTSCPWDCDQKLLQSVYQKFIAIPRPDYSSRFCVWTTLLSKYPAMSWQFDTSVMSKISDGYTVGSIVATIEEVMTVKRMLQLRIQPLNPLELVNVLCKKLPVYKEEEEAMETWWTKTPMFKRRLRAIEMLKEELIEMQAKQANKKK